MDRWICGFTQARRVKVLETFESNNKDAVTLRAGTFGNLLWFDGNGNAYIKFDDFEMSQWVFKRNFPQLESEHLPKARHLTPFSH